MGGEGGRRRGWEKEERVGGGERTVEKEVKKRVEERKERGRSQGRKRR